MPSPTAGDRYVKPLLTNMALQWLQDNSNYISTTLFPRVPVRLQGGKYAKYKREDFFRNPGKNALRGLSQESVGTKFNTDTGDYFARRYALHKDIDDQERVNTMSPFGPEREAVAIVMQQLAILREVEFIETYFKAGVWGTDLTGKSTSPGSGEFLQFDQDGSDPVELVHKLKVEIGRTGFIPNRIGVDYATHVALTQNAAIKDRVKYGGSTDRPAVVTTRTLAQLFEVDEYVVGRAVQTVTPDGAAEGATDYIMKPGLLLVHAPATPSINTPSAGYTFPWTGMVGGGNEFGVRVKQFRMESLSSDRVEGEMAYDMRIVAPVLGAYLSDTIGS